MTMEVVCCWWYANVECGVIGDDVIFLDRSSAADGPTTCALSEIRNIQTAIDAKNESM